jgi:hypothetical protein
VDHKVGFKYAIHGGGWKNHKGESMRIIRWGLSLQYKGEGERGIRG